MKKALFFLLLSFILCFCVLLFQLRQERKLLERTLRQMDTLREELIRTKRENARILGELFLQKNASLPEEEWYRWLEEALDRYENNAVREVRTAFPRCKEYQIRRLCLFFAGLSYPAIRALTKKPNHAFGSGFSPSGPNPETSWPPCSTDRHISSIERQDNSLKKKRRTGEFQPARFRV